MVLAGKFLYTLVNERDLCPPLVQKFVGCRCRQPSSACRVCRGVGRGQTRRSRPRSLTPCISGNPVRPAVGGRHPVVGTLYGCPRSLGNVPTVWRPVLPRFRSKARESVTFNTLLSKRTVVGKFNAQFSNGTDLFWAKMAALTTFCVDRSAVSLVCVR